MLAISDIGVLNIHTLIYDILYRPVSVGCTKSVVLIRGISYQCWLSCYTVRICTTSTFCIVIYYIGVVNINFLQIVASNIIEFVVYIGVADRWSIDSRFTFNPGTSYMFIQH